MYSEDVAVIFTVPIVYHRKPGLYTKILYYGKLMEAESVFHKNPEENPPDRGLTFFRKLL